MLSLSKRLLHKTLKKLAEKYKPKSYLEIGVRDGDSLKAVLNGYRPRRVYLCDTWGEFHGGTNRGSDMHIRKLIGEFPNTQKTVWVFLNGDSHKKIPELNKHIRFSLITVDGDHTYNGALTDLRNCWRVLKDIGGILVFDDVIHKSHKYLKDCIENFIRDVYDECIVLEKNYKDDNGIVVLMKNVEL